MIARFITYRSAWLGGHEPASTLVYVARLAAPAYRVEVEAWACRA